MAVYQRNPCVANRKERGLQAGESQAGVKCMTFSCISLTLEEEDLLSTSPYCLTKAKVLTLAVSNAG